MIFDTVVIFALLFSAVIAFLRGFIREVLTILGLVLGAAAAYAFGPRMVPVMVHALGEKGTADYKFFGLLHGDIAAHILAYASIFFPILIAASIASWLLADGARALGLGPLDRTLGVVFGIGRAVLLLSLLYLPFYLWTDREERDKSPLLEGSHTRVVIESVAGWMVSVIPDRMLAGVKKDADQAAKEAKSARQTLQDMDMLRKKETQQNQNSPAANDGGDHAVQPVPEPAPAGPPSPGPGYGPQQRQDMGNLIDKGLNQ
jgi:membrane protein required for colicin V production